jgi:serine/threonine-protein kinase
MTARAVCGAVVGAVVLGAGGLGWAGEPTFEEKRTALEKHVAEAPAEAQVRALNELAALLVRRNPADALVHARRALELAPPRGDVTGEAIASKWAGLALMVLEKDAEGLTHMRRAQELFTGLGDRAEAARTLGYCAMMLDHLGKVWEAVAACEKALAIFRELDDAKGMAAATNNLGVMHEKVGDHQQALQYNLEALRIEESLGRKIGIANNLNSIGNIYARLDEQLKARDYYERALAIYRELDEPDGIGKCLNNIGNTYEKLDEDDRAMEYFAQAVAIARQIGKRSNEADPLNNMGIVYKKRGQYEKARAQYFEEVKIRTELQQAAALGSDYHNIAETYFLEKRYDEALAYLDRALAVGREVGSNEILSIAYRLLAQVYAGRGDYRKAFEHQILYADTRAAMLDEQRNEKIAELQEKYQADARQQEIVSLSKDKELLTKDGEIRRLALARTRLIAALLIAVCVAVALAAALLFRRYLYLLAFWRKRAFIGPYRLEQEITRGGMGVVYRASNVLGPGTTVALKVIREELSGDDKQRERFINEGKIIDALDHPNIVKVLDRGEHNRRLYIAMEYLEGPTLAELLSDAAGRGEQLPLSRCLSIMGQLAEAVATIHSHGIVHRDITPANVLVVDGNDPERVKLLDFGIAKLDTMRTITEAGEILGTVNYIAPERLRLGEPTAASDTFSLGVLFYELLTLQKPFLADEPAQVLKQVLSREPVEPQLYRPEIAPTLAALVLAMLSKEPTRRPGDEEIRHRVGVLAGEAA